VPGWREEGCGGAKGWMVEDGGMEVEREWRGDGREGEEGLRWYGEKNEGGYERHRKGKRCGRGWMRKTRVSG
jgi:hypothetical protein